MIKTFNFEISINGRGRISVSVHCKQKGCNFENNVNIAFTSNQLEKCLIFMQ